MGSSSTNIHIVSEDLLRAFYKLLCLRFCVSSGQWKDIVQQKFYKEFEKDFYMDIILTTIQANLVTNSLLSLFCSFVETKTRIKFSPSWWSGNEKYLSILFLVSRALLQRYAKFNRLLEKDFLTRHSCSYYSSMVLRKKNLPIK